MMRRLFTTAKRMAVFAGIALLASLAIFPATFAAAADSPGSPAATEAAGSSFYEDAPPPPKGAEVVHVGIEPIQAYGVSLEAGTFQTSFYIWWRWHGPIDPAPTTDILNSIATSSNYVTQYSYTNALGHETPTKLKDGDEYQTAKISVGVTDEFSASRYPFDHQDLELRIENNTYNFHQLDYVPDTANMSKNPEFTVADWKVTGEYTHEYLHQYGTNFGLVGQGEGASEYSQMTYNIGIDRPVSHFVVKLFLPMVVVLLAALSALFVRADKFDVRLAMAGTGLLTFIFLQDGYAGDLPSAAPVVLMDEIYLLAYAAVGVTFLRVIFTTVRIHMSSKEPEIYVKRDRWIAIGTVAAFFIGTIALLVS